MVAMSPRSPAHATRAIEVARDEQHCRALFPHLAVAYWHTKTLPSAVAGLAELVRRGKQLFPDGLALLQVVSVDAEMPNSQIRAQLADLLREGGGRVVGSSVVVPGVGFKVATARGFVTGLALLVRPPFPHVVHSTIGESALWLSQLLLKSSVHVSASELRGSVESLVSSGAATTSDSS